MIIGGLIAIAVLALLGAFFLARGGGDKKEKPARVESARPATPVQPDIENKATVPAPEVKNEIPQLEFPKGSSLPDISEDTTTVMPQVHEYLARQSEPDVAALNRRLYELAGQLHILQRQSRDIEQGLMHLSGVIEQMNRKSHNNGSDPLLTRNASVPAMPYSD